MENLNNDDLDSSSSDEPNNESDNESDNDESKPNNICLSSSIRLLFLSVSLDAINVMDLIVHN